MLHSMLFLSVVAVANPSAVGNDLCEAECSGGFPWDSEDIVEWVRSRDGYFDRRIQIQHGPLGRGIFATEDIRVGEAIVDVPFSLMLLEGDHPCSTIAQLREELLLGRCSRVWPYLKSMQEVVLELPDSWSADELSLLDGLPPGDWHKHSGLYASECGAKYGLGGEHDLSDPFLMRALYLYVTRSGPHGMQPLFDIFNHGYNSTQHFPSTGPEPLRHIFYAANPIAAGSEVLNTFRPGPGHGRTAFERMAAGGSAEQLQGAPVFFRDYGFVEQVALSPAIAFAHAPLAPPPVPILVLYPCPLCAVAVAPVLVVPSEW